MEQPASADADFIELIQVVGDSFREKSLSLNE
jgi:hypothetical protein